MSIKESLLIFYITAAKENKVNILREWVKSETNIRKLISRSDDINSLFLLFFEITHANISQSKISLYINEAKEILSICTRDRIHILTPYDGAFPNHILSISNPPMLLFAKGDIGLLSSTLAIAVVGTREPIMLSINHARMVVSSLVKNNVIVVSGLALGCDSIAHQETIENHGKTIAVLAHGLDMIYPSQNIRLAEDIIDSGGCLISEYLPGVQPTKYQFIERDRIQSGLSSGVIVIECQESSGTMHTARAAKEQSKFLACISCIGIDSHLVSGNKILLQQGAFSINSKEDVDIFLQQSIAFKARKTRKSSDFFKPVEPILPEENENIKLAPETLLRINRNKLKALNIRRTKIEQGEEGNLQNLDRIIEETIKEIDYLEERLLANDGESSSTAKKAKLTVAHKA